MNKNFDLLDLWPGAKRIRAYENGKWIVDMILTDDNINGACKILEALGYKLLRRE